MTSRENHLLPRSSFLIGSLNVGVTKFFFVSNSFKRRNLHVPNLMQTRKIYCFRSFALDSAQAKCDV